MSEITQQVLDAASVRLKNLKAQADAANTEFVTAQADRRNAETTRQEVVEELATMDLTPQTLPDHMTNRFAEYTGLMDQAEGLLKGEQA